MVEKAKKADVTFESAKKRLGEIVEKLETGDLPLEESLRLFEEGIVLSRASQSKLDEAEKRIEILLRLDAEGNIKTAPFELRGEPRDPQDREVDQDEDL